eukprot:763768-Hanusia_phi.AAC.2
MFSRSNRKAKNVIMNSAPTSSSPPDHIDFSDNDAKGQICPEQRKVLALESKLSLVQPLDHYHFSPRRTSITPTSLLCAENTCQFPGQHSLCSPPQQQTPVPGLPDKPDGNAVPNFDKFFERNGHMSIQRLKPLPDSMPTRNSLMAVKDEPAYIYHSPYQRAVQTCRQLIQALDYEQVYARNHESPNNKFFDDVPTDIY